MQGTGVLSLAQEDPTCQRANELMHRELLSPRPRDHQQQLLKPTHPRAQPLQQEKPPLCSSRVAPAHHS